MPDISLRDIENYNTGHLGDSADYGQRSGRNWDENYGISVAEIDGADWLGVAYTAMSAKGRADRTVAQEAAEITQTHAGVIRLSAASLSTMKQTVLLARDAASNAKLTVDDNATVRDPNPPKDPAARAARQAEAEMHRDTIVSAAEAFHAHEQEVAALIQGHAATLTGVPLGQSPQIQMAGHGFKTDGPSVPLPAPAPVGPPVNNGPAQVQWPPAGGVPSSVANPKSSPPVAIINQRPGKPGGDHPCGPLEVGIDAGESIAGGVGAGISIATAPATGGMSLAGLGPAGIGVAKGFEDLQKCEHEGLE